MLSMDIILDKTEHEMNRVVRLAIVDDHQLFGTSLKYLLEDYDQDLSFRCVHYLRGEDFLEQFKKDAFDCVLLDLNLPGKSGNEILQEVLALDRNLNVIILTAYDQSNLVKECMQGGAAGFILKGNSLEELISAIKSTFQGETYLGEGVNLFTKTNREENEFSNKNDAFLLANKLTKREKEVLDLIIDAKTNKEIASILFISDQTVGVHRKNIMRKLAVNNTASLIKKAIELQMSKF